MKIIRPTILLILFSLLFLNCDEEVHNSITFRNLASGDVYVNFFGEVFTVRTGASQTVRDLPHGLFSYSTTYEIPAGVQSSSTEGAVSGEVQINADTKIMVLYSSALQGTGTQLTYVLSATISTNDKVIKNPTTP